MFKSIQKSDITIRPFKVYKNWTLDNTIAPIYAVEHLSGSFENNENREVAGYKEYSLNPANSLFFIIFKRSR